MAAWNAGASCAQPEDSSSLATTNSPGGRSFVVRGGGGGAGAGAAPSAGGGARGRRIGSRGRTTSEPSDAAHGGVGGEDRSWSRVGLERRESDAGSRGGGAAGGAGGAGRGRGRSKKEDVMWVQCDKCLRWRKLALGMRLEDLPDKW